jgi:hypothetical protein
MSRRRDPYVKGRLTALEFQWREKAAKQRGPAAGCGRPASQGNTQRQAGRPERSQCLAFMRAIVEEAERKGKGGAARPTSWKDLTAMDTRLVGIYRHIPAIRLSGSMG